MRAMAAILKFKPHLPNHESDGAETSWQASGRFRIPKSFSSSVQDGGHGGNLETLQTTSDSGLQSDLIAKMATMAHCNIS